MEHKMLEIKAGVTAFLGVLGTFLGWKGVLVVIWGLAMALDYVSGSLAAHKNHEWDSAKAREGLLHKGGMILVVLVAMLFDACLALAAEHLPVLGMEYPGLIFPVVLVWYILTEAGSVLENSIELGAAVPEWLSKGLKISLKTVEQAGEDGAHE